MKLISLLFTTSIGKKMIMAVTGVLMTGFIIGHLSGNLLLFAGPEQINAYGHFLKSMPAVLWSSRVGLLILLALHVWAAVTTKGENQAARPVGYAGAVPFKASFASRYMVLTGLVVLAFVIYHLLHYTVLVQAVNMTGQNFHTFIDDQGRHDVYRMVVTGFSNPVVSVFYIAAMALLALHLSHGVSALFQSIGLRSNNARPGLDRFATVFAVVIFIGYSSIPVSVLAGIIK